MNRLKRRRRKLAALLLLLLLVGNVVLLQVRIAPLIRRMAENQVVNAASDEPKPVTVPPFSLPGIS